MADSCHFLNPLRRDGTSQRQRLLAALRPSYIAIDERSTADLLLYARNYAELLQYYTETNTAGGNWVEFLENDISVLIAIIGDVDATAAKKEFKQLSDVLEAATPADRSQAIAALFTFIFELLLKVDGWHQHSIEGLSLRTNLEQLIHSVLNDSLRDLLAIALQANNAGLEIETDTSLFSDIWSLQGVVADNALFNAIPPSADDYDEAMTRISELFNRAYEVYVKIVEQAPSYLDETLESYPQHEPHAALFIAFVQLLRHAQDQLNTLTGKHLNFYYEEVLQLERKPAIADQVHTIFELAKRMAPERVVEDTGLKAGKDNLGKELRYGLDDELVVSHALINGEVGLKSLYVDKHSSDGAGHFKDQVINIYAASDADSADGLGAENEDEEGKWLTFGGKTMPYARIGFAIASPMLFLAEGVRMITVRLYISGVPDYFEPDRKVWAEQELQYNLRVTASGAEEWIDLTISSVTLASDSGQSYMEFTLQAEAGQPAIVAYDYKIYGEQLQTDYPLLRFILDNTGLPADLAHVREIADYSDEVASYDRDKLVRYDGKVYRAKLAINKKGFRPDVSGDQWQLIPYAYPYKYFQNQQLERLSIEIAVQGVRNLILENDVGVLNPSKPFHPFGTIPRANSSFLIGSNEIFNKPLYTLTLKAEWADLPSTNFKTHYEDYKQDGDKQDSDQIVTGNEYFTARGHLLAEGAWQPIDLQYKENALKNESLRKEKVTALEQTKDGTLFLPEGDDKVPQVERNFYIEPGAGAIAFNPQQANFTRFSNSLRQGFFRLQLNHSFLQELYPKFVAAAAKVGGPAIPNPPYVPMMASLSIDYSATQTVVYAKKKLSDFEERIEQLFHLSPFGFTEVFPIADQTNPDKALIDRHLVPHFPVSVTAEDEGRQEMMAEGTLYIGIEKLEPAQNLAILFQIAEGSEAKDLPAQKVVWSYLSNNRWVDFSNEELLTERTNGLLTSGIIEFAMPKAMSSGDSVLPSAQSGGLHWIKASVHKNSAAVCKLIALHAQAVLASFRDHDNDPQHLQTALAPQSISKLRSRIAAIKSVTQPYASFGGKMAESDTDFQVRVSERLRHKNRAVTIFDYERLVLEAFPEVYKVKCINHTSQTSEFQPGHVKLIVVPDLRNKNAVNPFAPRLSLNRREGIKKYLQELVTDFVKIEVSDPQYETIRVDFKVRFKEGIDKGFYQNLLNKDIINFLSPWLTDEGADLQFGARIHRSVILKFIEDRSYVEFVTDFRMDQAIDGVVQEDIEIAYASTSSSVLVSERQHGINSEATSCDEREAAEVAAAVTVPTAAQSVADAAAFRYLGNRRSREMHDLLNIKGACQLDEIAEKWRLYFETREEGTGMGYDYCAFCFGMGLSKK